MALRPWREYGREVRKAALRALLGVMILALGCKTERWTGVVYPDRSNLLVHRELGEFGSLEECRESARMYLRDIGAGEKGDYECGKNCRRSPDYSGMNVCEETRR